MGIIKATLHGKISFELDEAALETARNCEGIKLDIPGYGIIAIKAVLSDMTGTAFHSQVGIDPYGKPAVEWIMPQRSLVRKLLACLREKGILYHIVTGDTTGKVPEIAAFLDARYWMTLMESDCGIPEMEQKRLAVDWFKKNLGEVVFIGNGWNDMLAVQEADLGICITGYNDGYHPGTATAARICFPSYWAALQALVHPIILRAGLRH